MAGLGIVGCCPLMRRDDVREMYLVMFGKPVRGGLGRGRLQIVKITVLFLIIRQTLAHMLENTDGKFLRLFMGQILAQPSGIKPCFVHAEKSDGREVIVKAAEIPFGIGIQPFFHQLADCHAFDLQTAGGNVHHPVKTGKELSLVCREIGDARHIDGNNADGAGGFAAAEKSAGLSAKLTQIKPQTAAHTAYIGRLHIRIDVVGKIGGAEFRRHFK